MIFPVTHVDVSPGDTTSVTLGAPGPAVVGRLTGAASYEGVTLRVHPTAPHIGFHWDGAQWRAWSDLRTGPLGKSVFRDGIPVAADGTFRVEGLVPESYQLFVEGGRGRLTGSTSFRLKAGEADGPATDLGEVRVKCKTD